MNDPKPPTCPHCGSSQLIVHNRSRRIFINHEGERIPLLTVNFRLDHPVMEESAVTYTCSCSWNGNGTDNRPES
jgi:predicted RNA-binding Zn-ribbon protein involved in translation (DUF1610 family)